MDPVYDAIGDWGRQVLPRIGRSLRVSEPFFGLGGLTEFLNRAGVQVELVSGRDNKIIGNHIMEQLNLKQQHMNLH